MVSLWVVFPAGNFTPTVFGGSAETAEHGARKAKQQTIVEISWRSAWSGRRSFPGGRQAVAWAVCCVCTRQRLALVCKLVA